MSKQTPIKVSTSDLNDTQLLQFSRQIMLPEIGIEGQQRLLDASVLIIGVGGLGSPLAIYLVAAGIGHLTLVDDDQVELSNLQRQIIHDHNSLGLNKTLSAKQRLENINPDCSLQLINRRPDEAELLALIEHHDVIADATDNFASRFLINRLCVQQLTPLVSGAAIRWQGQVTVFRNDRYNPGPCYQCLFPPEGEEDLSCTGNGVIAPLVGIIGSVQALEVIKLICNAGQTLTNRMLVLDGLGMQWRSVNISADPNCEICQHGQS